MAERACCECFVASHDWLGCFSPIHALTIQRNTKIHKQRRQLIFAFRHLLNSRPRLKHISSISSLPHHPSLFISHSSHLTHHLYNMALNWTADSSYRIQDGAFAWPQQVWSNKTTCWRPAPDLNITYMAFAMNGSNPTAPPVWRMYQELETCCSGEGNFFQARADCEGVACMTNNRKLVEDWSNCTLQKLSGFRTTAIKVNYAEYEKQSQIAKSERSAAPRNLGTKASVLMLYALASAMLSALV
ncbi:hypothetical protein EJ08DRAFT_733048, partial [Tothia fuscella]